MLAQAEKLQSEVFSLPDLQAVRAGVAKIESLLAPIGPIAKQYTLYAVGHAHIDMNWMWGWPETVAVTHDSFSTVLKLMEEFPTFCFSQSQASTYAIIERHNPTMLAAIRKRIQEGRWEVTASHWVEGERNIVSGESLTRHLLHTRRYLKQTFGLSTEDVQIDWAPDTFGHPETVPMYLSRGGVKWVYLHRPGAIGGKRPQAFWWQSRDGSRVLVHNDMNAGYNGSFGPSVAKLLTDFAAETGLKFRLFVYGVGDHGGGPTRHDLSRALEMNSWPIFPNITFARARDYYARLEKEGASLPTLTCELNTEVTGCYTTQSLIKRSNRIAENRLVDAEAFCTIAAAATQRSYPHSDFVDGWRDTLFGHFHDILPGSNVHDSRTYMHGLFQKTIAASSMAETLALRELAGHIHTQSPVTPPETLPPSSRRSVLGSGVGFGSQQHMIDQAEQTAGGTARPVVVFNPVAWERREVVEATIWTDFPAGWQLPEEANSRAFSVRTPDGSVIEAQKIETGCYWGHAFIRLAFPAQVPPLGYATYTILEEAAKTAPQVAHQITPPHHCFYLLQERRPEGLENDLLRLELDPFTGGIQKLLDKRSGLALIDTRENTSLLEYVVEKPHPMTAWLIDNICQRQTPRVLGIDRKLDGPYKATVDVRLQIQESELTLTYELRAGDPQLYLHLRGTWFQRGTPQTGIPVLRLSLPLTLQDSLATYEIPFGALTRNLNDGQELPAVNWAMVTGQLGKKKAGLLLANDCKHGHSLDGNTFRLTIIRSAYDPDPLPEIGQHEIHLAIRPLAGELSIPEAIRTGRNLNRPLRLVGTSIHQGDLPAVANSLVVDNPNVLVSDLKQTEEGDGIILRLLNSTPTPQKVSVRLEPRLLGTQVSAVEVDLMEQPLSPSPTRLTKGILTKIVPAYAMSSFKLLSE